MTTATRKRSKTTGGVTLDRLTLLNAVKGVAAAVPHKSPKPILQNVLLHQGELRGSDLELQIAFGLPWTDEPLLLPHARLRSILEAATGDEVTLVRDGSACRVWKIRWSTRRGRRRGSSRSAGCRLTSSCVAFVAWSTLTTTSQAGMPSVPSVSR
jgi:hypothetical protein